MREDIARARVTAALVGAWWFSHGCSITLSESLPPDPTRLLAEVTITESEGRYQLLGTIHAGVDEYGAVVGALALTQFDTGPVLVPLTGQRDGALFSFDSGRTDLPGGVLQWDAFELALLDVNGDGFVHDGTGTLAGPAVDANGTEPDGRYSAAVSLARDRGTGSLELMGPPPRSRSHTIFPMDSLQVVFSEPISSDGIAKLQIQNHGVPVAGSWSVSAFYWTNPQHPLSAIDGLVTALTFRPSELFPPDSMLQLEANGVEDPAGNIIVVQTFAPLQTPPDAGDATANVSFENDLANWLSSGAPRAVGPYCGVSPVHGARQAIVEAGSSLAGSFVVPATASRLELSVAVFSVWEDFEPGLSAVVALHGDQEPVIGFDAHAAGTGSWIPTCDDGFNLQVGPVRVGFDLVPLRDKRVFLTASSATSSSTFGLPSHAVVLDDLVIE